MPDLLLELFSEEIPARMQRRAAEDLQRLVTGALVEAGFVYEGAKAFATPRRLALTVNGIPARSPDIREERKGPRIDAPEQAIAGFLRGAGLSSVDQATVKSDPKKGDFYVAIVEKPGAAAEALLAEALPKIIRDFPWPKSMRWGAASKEQGSLRWVRPLHAIVAMFGPETENPVVVPFNVDGIAAGDTTFGHRFMAPAPINVRRFDDYQDALQGAKVVLDADRRKDIILHDARERAFALGLELIEDEGLLEEVAGLNEWPVVLVGAFDDEFLEIPKEAIRATIRANQKCFVVADQAGNLASRFVMVANIEASDGGAEIVAGNERVIRARLADARHFWNTDRRPLPGHDSAAMQAAAERLGLDLTKPLDQRMAKLAATDVVFHEKLGTQGERVERIVRLAGELADVIFEQLPPPAALPRDSLPRERGRVGEGADRASFRRKVERAAALAKADLTTEMVGEFPELQGLMGRYYAAEQGEDASVTAAIEDHYKPQGPGDSVPTDPVAIAVALADKLDMLVAFWAIDEKPTGSKDPYALRRAALGVIRIVLEREIKFGSHYPYLAFVEGILWPHYWRVIATYAGSDPELLAAKDATRFSEDVGHQALPRDIEDELRDTSGRIVLSAPAKPNPAWRQSWSASFDLLAFFADRLKVQLREEGARHDLVDAVFALGRAEPPPPLRGRAGEGGMPLGTAEEPPSLSLPLKGGEDHTTDAVPGRREGAQDDLLLLVRRIGALSAFLDTEDGRNLLAGYRRAANILRDEEKKAGAAFAGDVVAALLTEPEEVALNAAVDAAEHDAAAAIDAEDFAAAMAALAKLRVPVDSFFDKVLVNAPDANVRANRLRLLGRIREAMLTVADFARIEG